MKEEIITKEQFVKDMEYALGKFDWGKSFLDADAIRILNEWKIKLETLLAQESKKTLEDLQKEMKVFCSSIRDVEDIIKNKLAK
jgi:hypothetical protein